MLIYRGNVRGLNEDASPVSNSRQTVAFGGDVCDEFSLLVVRWSVMRNQSTQPVGKFAVFFFFFFFFFLCELCSGDGGGSRGGEDVSMSM